MLSHFLCQDALWNMHTIIVWMHCTEITDVTLCVLQQSTETCNVCLYLCGMCQIHVRCVLLTCNIHTLKLEATHKQNMRTSKVLRSNGYPGAFIHSGAQPPQREEGPQHLPLERSSPLGDAVHSEDIRWVCGKYGMKVIFKAGRSLRSVLTKVKDPLPMEKKTKLVYRIPCNCGQSYISETRRRLETRLREH